MNFFLAIFLVFLLDQAGKFLVIRYLAPVVGIKILPFFHLTYQENTGAAFSILSGKNTFFIFTSLFVISVIIFWLIKEKKYNFPFALVLGGALGNLFDRIVRGRVIDFLDFLIWPVFNFADSAVTIGTLLLFWQLFRKSAKYPPKR